MKNDEFSKSLKDLNLQMFKVVSKRHKELGINLTPIQGTIILAVYENQEALCQKHLEKFVSCNKSTLSSILDTMEKKHLIKRVSDSLDTRKKVIVLTKNAESLVEKIKEDKMVIEQGMLQGIEKEELEIFNTTLNKILRNLERM